MLAEEAGDETVAGTADVDGIGDGGRFPLAEGQGGVGLSVCARQEYDRIMKRD